MGHGQARHVAFQHLGHPLGGKKRDAQIIFSTILNYVCLLTLGVALILSLMGPTLFHIFTPPSFYPAISILPVIFLVRSMNVIEQPASTGIYLTGRTGLLAISYTVGLVANLVLLRLLVPPYGLLGTVLAWLCGSALVPILFLLLGQHRYRLSFRLKVLLPPVFLWIAVLGGTSYWKIETSGHRLLYEVLLAVLVCLVLGFVIAHDFRSLRRQIRLSTARSALLEVSS